MITRQFDQSLNDVQAMLLKMGAHIEIAIDKAMRALVGRDELLADEIVRQDSQIDEIEVQIDELVAKLIATQQPVAGDLRKLISALKIAADMERMGDLAKDIAIETISLAKMNFPEFNPLQEIVTMSKRVQKMVNDGINSYIDGNTMLAQRLAEDDDEVDRLYDSIVKEMKVYFPTGNRYAEVALKCCFVARYLERIADHATNIAENIIYIETGKQADLN
ncbi:MULTISPECIES: phosphate signaling complex protein PhoU [unclassified Thermoactinomyces]|jgi:phosphate transport system protein|uniref:phosphate signaling complex protein PhoU n=1 Tax=unclassified Thermoactinomyces TaxID=2634588 RepID=UPI001E34A23A|nr:MULTISPECIES: phosphate signaling complex protein PhoU [unclassified Thermoactinomyces]